MNLDMKYNEILKANLSDILEEIRSGIEGDEAINEFIKSKEDLRSLLDKQDKLLQDYLYDYEKSGELDEKYCWNFYKDLKIPYSVVYKSLQTLKIALMEKILDNIDNKSEVVEIEKYINHLLNGIAKVYIKKDIHTLKDANKSVFKKYLLFRAHLEWLNDLIEAIKSDDLSRFPLGTAEACEFSRYLEFPESMMVCMDANLCMHLHDLHHSIHKSANTFYLFYKKKDYTQAYIIYKELLESIMNFNKTITELYFLAYGNSEESLFRFIEVLLYRSSDNVHLSMIDIKRLKTLNTNFGELTINRVLEDINEQLQDLVHAKEDKILLVRGTTADYYMVDIGLNKEELKEITDAIYNITNRIYQVENKEIEIKSTVVTLSLDGFYGKNRDDLTRLVFHLKEEAKLQEGSLIVTSDEEKERLLAWLDNAYKDIDFISKKIAEQAIDVVFQPIYNIQTKEVEILEALVRLVDDSGKLIPAGMFIDTIYAIGKIEELDRLVLQKIKEYEKELKIIAKTVFVNISYRSILDSRYKEEFARFIDSFGNEGIIFELTEQSIVENIDDVLRLHNEFDVHFAVDDFGSGYSSLKTVSDLSKEGILKVLKVDESLVKNLNKDLYDKRIVDIIAKLANSLELKSVGEFIENKEVLDALKSYGITYAQGFYLSKPKTVDELLVEKLNGLLTYKD